MLIEDGALHRFCINANTGIATMIVDSFKQGLLNVLVTRKNRKKPEQALFVRFNFSQGYEHVQITNETAELLRAAITRGDGAVEFQSLSKNEHWVNLAKAESVEFYEDDRIYPKEDTPSEWVYIRLSDNKDSIDLVGCGSEVIESLSSGAEFIKVDDDVYVRRSSVLHVGYRGREMRIQYEDQDDILHVEFSKETISKDISYGWNVNIGYAANGIAEITILDAKANGYWPLENANDFRLLL